MGVTVTTDDIFKVMVSKVKVIDNLSGRGIPTDGSSLETV